MLSRESSPPFFFPLVPGKSVDPERCCLMKKKEATLGIGIPSKFNVFSPPVAGVVGPMEGQMPAPKKKRSSEGRREGRRRGQPYRSLVTSAPRAVKLYYISQFLPTSTREDVYPMRAMNLAAVEIQRVVRCQPGALFYRTQALQSCTAQLGRPFRFLCSIAP